MPLYRFLCPGCSATKTVLRSADRAGDELVCTCGAAMKRNAQGASSRIVETLDNGIMAKRVERPADVERLNWERSQLKPEREP